ncbi:glycerophosphodiester phosphodiesterase family protein [Dermabacteraceae bacterium TAE3-ERU27]|nr:glycerophosphodiester phosphodiesterase family protein [Dermabacteraceae bacterium TAE3-ERU27]
MATGISRTEKARYLRGNLEKLITGMGRPLVIAHRGTPLGSFPDNTLRSIIGSLKSGADIAETDVVRSVDGEYFLFHNTYEEKNFNQKFDICEKTSQEISSLRYVWSGGNNATGVEQLGTLLETLPDAWLNIDRSWFYWPELFDYLGEYGAERRVLLKSSVEDYLLDALAEHPIPFMWYPIVRTMDEFEKAAARKHINMVGAELLAVNEEDDFAHPDNVAKIRERYPLVQINALNLENGSRLFLDYNDDVSVLEDPEKGWGVIANYGPSAIQTDWPHLLRDYLRERFGSES